VSAILLCAIDVYGVRDAIDMARRFDVPVIAIDAIVAGKTIAQVGVDISCRRTAARCPSPARPRRGARIGIIGATGSYIQTLRYRGFLDAMKRRRPSCMNSDPSMARTFSIQPRRPPRTCWPPRRTWT
jgi:ribose transport system substrate-binding protein